jgi:hypothetical protein
MADERRYDILAPQVIQLQKFTARQVKVSNMLPRWLYLRTGGTDIPTAGNCDIAVPPMTEMTEPISPTSMVSVGLGVVIVTLGQQVESNKAILTFYDTAQPGAVGSIDLNPTRIGNMAQQKFVAPGSYTTAFPVTMVHVSNYSKAWVYVKFGSLVVPTAATADVTLPPMSEKSLACLPATQFAFGLSANLVTTGQQVPAGVNIIATFYEYPTPVTIGTADLNPSKLGQSVSTNITADSIIDPAFPVAQINISNYLRNWIHASYNFANRLLNPDFEDWFAGIPISWPFVAGGGGAIANDTPYRWTGAVRITKGGVAAHDFIAQTINVTPGETLTYSFWYFTSGIQAEYMVLNSTLGGWIIPPTLIPAAAVYTPFKVNIVVPPLTFQITFYLSNDAGNPAGSRVWYDASCVQLATTAANAQIAVPPMSEKSITLPPSDHIDVVVGTQTVMIATGIPVTSAIFTCYEYAVPTNLGVAPLSPGGFRYHELLHLVAAIPSGTLLERDLSNFAMARYTIKSNEIAATTKILYLTIWDYSDGTMNTACATIPLFRERWASVTFHAGKRIRIEYEEAAVGSFTLTDTLEAW